VQKIIKFSFLLVLVKSDCHWGYYSAMTRMLYITLISSQTCSQMIDLLWLRTIVAPPHPPLLWPAEVDICFSRSCPILRN
jgi:hypothetical protein